MMADMTKNEFPQTFPLRLPTSIRRQAGELAKTDDISLNQFIMLAVAEKLSALPHSEGRFPARFAHSQEDPHCATPSSGY